MGFCDLSRVTQLTMPKAVDTANFSYVTFTAVDLELYSHVTKVRMLPSILLSGTETKKAERPAVDAFTRGSANVAWAGEPATADVFARAKDKLATIKQSKTTQQQGYENE